MAATRETLVLSHGGFKSLVAMATVVPSGRPLVLFIRGDRPADHRAHQACIAACDHFQAGPLMTLAMEHLGRDDAGAEIVAPLAALEVLTAGAQQAVGHGSSRLVWATRAGDDFDKLSRVTEATVLVEHFAAAGGAASLSIETPLLEMTGGEVVEVGEQLGVPWGISRDCWQDTDEPCGQCPGCRERAAAFAGARVTDPLAASERQG